MTPVPGEVFYWLFNMSIAASLAGIAVLLIGKIKRLPRRFVRILWAIPLLRMWIPFGVGSKYGIMSLISKITTRTVIVYDGSQTLTMTNSVMAANSYFPITYKTNLLSDLFRVSSVIWIIVAVAVIFLLFVLQQITKRELRDAVLLRDNIYISDKVTSPAVYGVLRPRIIIPDSFRDKDLTMILAHENAHIKGADNFWRILAFVTAALHWFNPLSWVFLRSFLMEIELACDERVLARLSTSERKDYASMLLHCVEERNIFASAFGGAKVRVRIGNILSYRKLSLFSAVAFILLAAAIAYILLTNAPA